MISILAFHALSDLYYYLFTPKFIIDKPLEDKQLRLLGLDSSYVEIDTSLSAPDDKLTPVKTSTPDSFSGGIKQSPKKRSFSRSFNYYPENYANNSQLNSSATQTNVTQHKVTNEDIFTELPTFFDRYQRNENELNLSKNQSLNLSLNQSINDFSTLSMNQSLDNSSVSLPTYQIAVSTQPSTNSNGDTYKPVETAKIWAKLGIKPKNLEKWTENCRQWIANTILHKLVEEIDNCNKFLTSLGYPENTIGTASLLNIRQLTLIKKNELSNIPIIIPYLNIHPNTEYIVQRIKELARGNNLSIFRWNGGSQYKGAKWSTTLPTDSQIIMHLFCTYLDCKIPPGPSTKDGQPFTGSCFRVSATKIDFSCNLAIFFAQLNPPNFAIGIKGKDTLLSIPKGRLNLFHTLVVFIYYIYTHEFCMLGQINLSLLGLNLFCIIEK